MERWRKNFAASWRSAAWWGTVSPIERATKLGSLSSYTILAAAGSAASTGSPLTILDFDVGYRPLPPHRAQPHLSTRQYARIVDQWVGRAGLDSSAYRTHSMRRTKPAQIYKKTGNLRAVRSSLAIRSSKVPSAISALRWTTPSASQSRLSSESPYCPSLRCRGRAPAHGARDHAIRSPFPGGSRC